MIVRIFDINGNEILFSNNRKKLMQINVKNVAKKFLPQIIAGKTISTLEKINGLPETSVVIGVPVQKGDLITGALFVFVPADDVRVALSGFTLVFTVTLFIGTAIIGVLLRFYIKESKELDRTRREYVANVSHELKSPVSSIKALTETLADNVITDEDTRDDIFASVDYCPITNLDNADTAYEWAFNGINDYKTMKITNNGGQINRSEVSGTMTSDQVKLYNELKKLFPAYLNSLGLKKTDGTTLTLDANGEGTFKNYVKYVSLCSDFISFLAIQYLLKPLMVLTSTFFDDISF